MLPSTFPTNDDWNENKDTKALPTNADLIDNDYIVPEGWRVKDKSQFKLSMTQAQANNKSKFKNRQDEGKDNYETIGGIKEHIQTCETEEEEKTGMYS